MSCVSGAVLTKVTDTLNVTCGLNLLDLPFSTQLCARLLLLCSCRLLFVWLVGWFGCGGGGFFLPLVFIVIVVVC